MASKGKKKGRRRQHAGRVTLGPCEALGNDRLCEPLNSVWIWDQHGASRSYSSCTCGRRYRQTAAHDCVIPASDRSGLDAGELRRVVADMWPSAKTSTFAKAGVVPVGVEVLHQPTHYVDHSAGDEIRAIESRLLETMAAAQGIGLAANQVGAGVRLLAHNLTRVAPPVLLNPVVLSSSGEWLYDEGCLSLQVEGTRARLARPKKLTVWARLPDGGTILIVADELLSRVLQHELDHLEGIEYVQRLIGPERDRVYDRMDAAGVALSWLPERPY